jgi:uncharacterized protein (TIGR03089 family)
VTNVTELSIANTLHHVVTRDGSRPLITQLWAGGQRAELSCRTFENNVAKASNLLQDDADAGPDSTVLLQLPVHWQTSVWLTACALVGVRVQAVEVNTKAVSDEPIAAFVDETHAHQNFPYPTYVVSLHPLGLPAGDIPAGTIDLAREVRGFSDVFVPYSVTDAHTPWLALGGELLTQGQALERAVELAHSCGLEEHGRLLVTGALTASTALALSAMPLAVNASIVINSDETADLDTIISVEKCTAVLGD